ncbi:MAG: Rrf2 family transcriptional regulator [Lachnospiraceae bacterium]
MRISTKCSVALHILILLAEFNDHKLTSEILAKSTGCNPVIIRNILGDLKRAGVIGVRRGTGGAFLQLEPNDITIGTVFDAVDSTSLEEIIGVHPSPNPACPIGNNIYALLKKPYDLIASSIKETMQSYTLQQLLDDYHSNTQK